MSISNPTWKWNKLPRKKLDVDSLTRNHKEFIKNNRLILGQQQILEMKKYNVFTEKVYIIAFSANNNKRIESTDSIETYLCGTSKDKIYKNKKNKCDNIIKQYKKWLNLIILQEKANENIIQTAQKFLIIHTKY